MTHEPAIAEVEEAEGHSIDEETREDTGACKPDDVRNRLRKMRMASMRKDVERAVRRRRGAISIKAGKRQQPRPRETRRSDGSKNGSEPELERDCALARRTLAMPEKPAIGREDAVKARHDIESQGQHYRETEVAKIPRRRRNGSWWAEDQTTGNDQDL